MSTVYIVSTHKPFEAKAAKFTCPAEAAEYAALKTAQGYTVTPWTTKTGPSKYGFLTYAATKEA